MSAVRVVTLSAEELRALVTDAVTDAFEALGPTSVAPALLDRAGLARALDVSLATVDRLRSEGCPELRIGDAPRFELTAVLEWLRNRRTPRVSASQAGARSLETVEIQPDSTPHEATSGTGLLARDQKQRKNGHSAHDTGGTR